MRRAVFPADPLLTVPALGPGLREVTQAGFSRRSLERQCALLHVPSLLLSQASVLRVRCGPFPGPWLVPPPSAVGVSSLRAECSAQTPQLWPCPPRHWALGRRGGCGALSWSPGQWHSADVTIICTCVDFRPWGEEASAGQQSPSGSQAWRRAAPAPDLVAAPSARFPLVLRLGLLPQQELLLALCLARLLPAGKAHLKGQSSRHGFPGSRGQQ